MNYTEKTLVETSISEIVKNCKFIKTASTWRRITGVKIDVINLQRSQWSMAFYLNYGVYFTSIGTLTEPKEYECHIRTRVSALCPVDFKIDDYLDFTNDKDNSERITKIQAAVKYGLKWLDGITDKASAIKSGQDLGFVMISKSLNEL